MKLKKSFGQHLLVDNAFHEMIADATGAAPGGFCLEIGPGTGYLTSKLLQRGARVAAIEVDREMLPILENKFSGNPNFTLVPGDILKIDIDSAVPENSRPAVAVGNLPYNISSPIIFRLLERRHLFSAIYVMVQKEVAERMSAGPGSKNFGMLTVFCEIEADVTLLFDIPPSAFRPPPDVTSSLVKIVPAAARKYDIDDFQTFENTVKAAFKHRRKLILNSMLICIEKGEQKEFFQYLSPPDVALAAAIDAVEIPAAARAEEVSVKKFVDLSNRLYSLRNGPDNA